METVTCKYVIKWKIKLAGFSTEVSLTFNIPGGVVSGVPVSWQ